MDQASESAHVGSSSANAQNGNKPGVYVHDASGEKLTALNEPQADALVKVGFHLLAEDLEAEDKEIKRVGEALKAQVAEVTDEAEAEVKPKRATKAAAKKVSN